MFSRMLQVNSFFCDAALPHLYDGALLSIDESPKFGRIFLSTQKFKQLFQSILQQFPPEDVGPLLSAAFNVYPEPEPVQTAASLELGAAVKDREENGQLFDDKESRTELGQEDHLAATTVATLSTAKRRIDYLSHFRVLCVEKLSFEPIRNHHHVNLGKSLETFAFTSRTGELANGLGEGASDDMLVFPSISDARGFQVSELRFGAVSMAIRRQLTWLLCSRTFEQIRILTTPLSDVEKYLAMVERFPTL